MTQEEIQEQVELMQKTLDEQKTALAQKDASIAELNKKIAEAGKGSGPSDEELKALKAKAEKHDELDKKIKTLEGELTVTRLKSKYPAVDFDVIRPGTEAEMDTQAAKIQAMIDAAVKKAAPSGDPESKDKTKDPGYRWDSRGQGMPEEMKGKVEESKTKLAEAMKTGDQKGILDACFGMQPKATARLFDGLKQ